MFAKYAQFYKDNGFFAGSKIKATVTDNSFIGQEMVLSKGTDVIQTRTIPVSGLVEFFTDESGELTLSSDNGTSTISGRVEVTSYATYNVTLNGASSDTTREMYADKDSVTLDDDTTSETINISYTGDKASLAVKSSNTNVATATLNDNKVTISDAGKGYKGSSDVVVSVLASSEYQAKDFTIKVSKTNGQIDKSWIGLKNIVESGRASELCEVGEEYIIELSNGVTMTYIIGAINHDYDNQIIFVPKRYDYLDTAIFQRGNSSIRYESSSLCEYLNGTFFNMLPADMQMVISEKTVEYAISDVGLVSYTKKIWLPREYEILGETKYSHSKEREIYRIGRFECFTKDLVTLCGSASPSWDGEETIWLCSPRDNSDIVTAYRMNSTSYGNSYFTWDRYNKNAARAFPCFHIIKDS